MTFKNTLKMLSVWMLIIVALQGATSASFASGRNARDPYNALVWNRVNHVAQNGTVDRGDWYEWWYFKVIVPETGEALFFTYGVVNPWDQAKSLAGTKALVEVGSFLTQQRVSQEFEVSDFRATYDHMQVQIGDNTTTDKHMTGHIQQENHEVSWDIELTKQWRFNAMGFATSMPEISNIYWYPAQAAAQMTGWIVFDGRRIELSAAPAYQDRNWGRSFPKWWTWLTSNGFEENPNTVLAAGGGAPKAFDLVYLFSGLCIGLFHEGQEYIFRTTDADWVNFDIRWGHWSVAAENKRNQRIEISAYAPPEDFMTLPFQSPRGPQFYDYEALRGTMTVSLFKRETLLSNWQLVSELHSKDAGIEWGTPTPVGLMGINQLNFTTQ